LYAAVNTPPTAPRVPSTYMFIIYTIIIILLLLCYFVRHKLRSYLGEFYFANYNNNNIYNIIYVFINVPDDDGWPYKGLAGVLGQKTNMATPYIVVACIIFATNVHRPLHSHATTERPTTRHDYIYHTNTKTRAHTYTLMFTVGDCYQIFTFLIYHYPGTSYTEVAWGCVFCLMRGWGGGR